MKLNHRRKKNKNIDKFRELQIELLENKYLNKPGKLEIALRELNKVEVIDKNLHDIKHEISLHYTGEFEMVGNLRVDDHIRDTRVRFKNYNDYEAYINKIDQDYESDDAILNGYFYKLGSPHFNKVNRSQYGNGCDFEHEIIENRGNNCYIPAKCYCFVNCVNFLTGEDYKQQYLDFNGSDQRRSNNMTKARIQPFCRANNINSGYYDGERVFPRSVTERNNALYIYNNHFCLIWKSEGVSFNQAIK